MKIICQNCNKTYLISSEKINPSGRKVRCSACGTVWLQLPNRENIVTNDNPIKDSVGALVVLPKISDNPKWWRKNINLSWWPRTVIAILMIAITIVLTTAVFQEILPSNLQNMYQYIGLSFGEHEMELQRVAINRESDSNIRVRGVVYNKSHHKRSFPGVYAVVRNSKKKIIHVAELSKRSILIDSHSDTEFDGSIDVLSDDDIHVVEINIGNYRDRR